ncbi:MAG: hypothetical protein WD557_13315 [Dehalococcoidia bacterium]
MKLLRLGNSNDTTESVPEELKSSAVANAILEAASGEPVELVTRMMWPSEQIPGLVEKWLREYEPDLVLVVINAFWFTYESVPAKLKRRLGPMGRSASRAGIRLGEVEMFARNRAWQAARRQLVRTVGGDPHFTPAQVAERMDAVLRVVLAHEHMGVALRGSMTSFDMAIGGAPARRSEARFVDVSRRLSEVCTRLHVPYSGQDVPQATELQGDSIHATAQTHRRRGEIEGELLVRAWSQVREGVSG